MRVCPSVPSSENVLFYPQPYRMFPVDGEFYMGNPFSFYQQLQNVLFLTLVGHLRSWSHSSHEDKKATGKQHREAVLHSLWLHCPQTRTRGLPLGPFPPGGVHSSKLSAALSPNQEMLEDQGNRWGEGRSSPGGPSSMGLLPFTLGVLREWLPAPRGSRVLVGCAYSRLATIMCPYLSSPAHFEFTRAESEPSSLTTASPDLTPGFHTVTPPLNQHLVRTNSMVSAKGGHNVCMKMFSTKKGWHLLPPQRPKPALSLSFVFQLINTETFQTEPAAPTSH